MQCSGLLMHDSRSKYAVQVWWNPAKNSPRMHHHTGRPCHELDIGVYELSQDVGMHRSVRTGRRSMTDKLLCDSLISWRWC